MSEDSPRELVVDAAPAPGDASDGAGSAMAPFAIGAAAAGVTAKLASPTLALVPIALAILFVLFGRKRSRGRFVLRVDGSVLEIAREKGRDPPIRLPLSELSDVSLDKKAQASGRGGSTERVQIALERSEGAILMPEDRITPSEAQEWYGKIRVFLRKHGWVPASERPSTAT